MRMFIFSLAFVTAVLMMSAALASDVSKVECGLEVVYVGDLDDDVLSKCGEPTVDQGDAWVYDDPSVVIHFGDGGPHRRRVERIELKNE